MEENIEVLSFIYQNGQMGYNTILQLEKVVEDSELLKYLHKQKEGYYEFYLESKSALEKLGYDEQGIGMLKKIRTYLMITMDLQHDSSASGVAKMLMIGSNMGVVSSIENLHRYQNIERNVYMLLEKLQHFEENAWNSLKMFL